MTLPALPASRIASTGAAILDQDGYASFAFRGNNVRRHLGSGWCRLWLSWSGVLFLPCGCCVRVTDPVLLPISPRGWQVLPTLRCALFSLTSSQVEESVSESDFLGF